MAGQWLGAAALAVATAIVGPNTAPPAGDAAQLRRLDPAWAIANGCFAKTDTEAKAAGVQTMPLIAGLAPIHFPIGAATARAQRYFDQGFALLYGFEYEKAARSFAAGRTADADCTMCLWGQALAMGPYINSGPLGADQIARARTLTQQALAANNLSPFERSLVTALDDRYAPGSPKTDAVGVFSVRYAEAMAAIVAANPANDAVLVLAAEAAMNVRPWDYWLPGGAVARPWAARAIALVETVLKRNPDQPEAQHLYIHLTEASANPGRAERFADKLEKSSPASAHLVHMPSHTYYRIGRYADGVRVNRRAIDVDDAMAARLGEAKPFYGYFRHHTHFIVSAAEQIGDAATARAAAAKLEASFAQTPARGLDYAQALLTTALHARAQFATAGELLALPAPAATMPILRQLWYAARAEALGREGRAAAKRELAAMRAERRRVTIPREARPVIMLAEQMALGRIAYGAGDYRAAERRFRKAAKIEATFDYNEPPTWHQPVQAALGAALLKRGDAAGARTAFDHALARRPGNGWALWGRAQAEAASGDGEAARMTIAKLDAIWKGDRTWLRLERL